MILRIAVKRCSCRDCTAFGLTPDHGSDIDDRDDVRCGQLWGDDQDEAADRSCIRSSSLTG
jgi:hypothetical protein